MIYFIQDTATNKIKIGVSQKPMERLAGLQTACVGKLILIGVMDGARQEEIALHEQFTQHRGEWFDPTTDLLTYIRTNAITAFDRPVQTPAGVKLAGGRYLATDWGLAQWDRSIVTGTECVGFVAWMIGFLFFGLLMALPVIFVAEIMPPWAVIPTVIAATVIAWLLAGMLSFMVRVAYYIQRMDKIQQFDPVLTAKLELIHECRNDAVWDWAQWIQRRTFTEPRFQPEADAAAAATNGAKCVSAP